MANVAVVGAQWGDEGKGKIVDWLSERADIVVRFQGGHNAGHTLVIDGIEYKLSLLPSGVVRPGKLSIIGNGVVVDPWALLDEIDAIAAKGVDVTPENLQARRQRGADPAVARRDRPRARGGARREQASAPPGAASARPTRTRSAAARSASATSPIPRRSATRSTSCCCITTRCCAASARPRSKREQLLDALHRGGAQGAALCRAGLAAPRRGAPRRQAHPLRGRAGRRCSMSITALILTSPRPTRWRGRRRRARGSGRAAVGYVLGITKAYTTRVGSGPFPTELTDEIGETLGERGNEFGVVTGRQAPLRLVRRGDGAPGGQGRGIDGIALTKLDVLDGFDEIKVCTGYRRGDETYDHLPPGVTAQAEIEPIYENFDGWRESTRGAPLLGRSAGERDQIHPPHRGADRGAGGAALHQPRARRHGAGARPLRGLMRRELTNTHYEHN